jgi:hypothetical protein
MNIETSPLLGGAFLHNGKCFLFHGYDMSSIVRPRISWMEVRVSYAPEWQEQWGDINRAIILRTDPKFEPRNSKKKDWSKV